MSKLTIPVVLISAAAVAQPSNINNVNSAGGEPPISGSSPNLNYNTPQHTPEWCEGWQAGWHEAAVQVWHNRNHNRALLRGQAPETQQQAMDRIHNSLPALPGQVVLPRSSIEQAIDIVLNSIDLYVVLHVDYLPQEPKPTAEGCH